jgi:hypothetical protein
MCASIHGARGHVVQMAHLCSGVAAVLRMCAFVHQPDDHQEGRPTTNLAGTDFTNAENR